MGASSKTNRRLLEPDESYEGIGQLGGVATLFPIHPLPGGDDFLRPLGIGVNGQLSVGGRVIAEQLGPEESRLDQHRADPEGGDLWRERLHPPLEAELRGGVRRAKHLAGDAGGRRDGDEQSGALLPHYWQYGASDIHRAEQERLNLIADLFRAEFLEEAGEEIARIVDQNVNSSEFRDGGLNGRLRVLWPSHIELDGQQVVVIAHRGGDLRRLAASGDDGVAGRQGGLC